MQRHQGYELLERIGSLLHAELRKRGAEYGLQPAHLQALSFFICREHEVELVG